MVIFDKLRISRNAKEMYIDAHVNEASYYDDVYLGTITICTADQVSESSPEVPSTGYVYKETFDANTKEISLTLTPTDFNLNYSKTTFTGVLFFVYIECTGTPSSDTPCGMDNTTTLGVVFDENMLYNKILQYTKSLTRDCVIPKDFIDLILLWYGFKSAINTGHYIVAIDFWNRLFGTTATNSIYNRISNCGCHG